MLLTLIFEFRMTNDAVRTVRFAGEQEMDTPNNELTYLLNQLTSSSILDVK